MSGMMKELFKNALSQLPHALLMVRFLLFLSVVSAFACYSPCAFANSGTKQIHVLKLVQKHFFLGSVEVLIASDAVKVLIKSNQSVFLARAPKWKVVEYCPGKRVAHEISFSDFRQTGSTLLSSSDLDHPNAYAHLNLQKGGQSQFAGFPVRKLVRTDITNGPRVTYWLLESKASNEACMILDHLFRIPEANAVPISFVIEERSTAHKQDDELPWLSRWSNAAAGTLLTNPILLTTSIKQEELPEGELAYPVGYKLVADERSVFITSNKQELFENFYFGSNPGTHKTDRMKTSP
jgi:hypothetical protein